MSESTLARLEYYISEALRKRGIGTSWKIYDDTRTWTNAIAGRTLKISDMAEKLLESAPRDSRDIVCALCVKRLEKGKIDVVLYYDFS